MSIELQLYTALLTVFLTLGFLLSSYKARHKQDKYIAHLLKENSQLVAKHVEAYKEVISSRKKLDELRRNLPAKKAQVGVKNKQNRKPRSARKPVYPKTSVHTSVGNQEVEVPYRGSYVCTDTSSQSCSSSSSDSSSSCY